MSTLVRNYTSSTCLLQGIYIVVDEAHSKTTMHKLRGDHAEITGRHHQRGKKTRGNTCIYSYVLQSRPTLYPTVPNPLTLHLPALPAISPTHPEAHSPFGPAVEHLQMATTIRPANAASCQYILPRERAMRDSLLRWLPVPTSLPCRRVLHVALHDRRVEFEASRALNAVALAHARGGARARVENTRRDGTKM